MMRPIKTMQCACLTLALLAGSGLAARAESTDSNDLHASRAGVTLGGRAAYYRPKDADSGKLSGGAQARLHFTSIIAVEGSIDYRSNRFEDTRVDVYPVQASLLLYLMPKFIVSPYALGGVGWYFTHVEGGSTTNRYGPHAGGGLEAALARHWTIDGSYRYLWAQSLDAPTRTSPAGKNFSDHGFMLTAALHYRF